jgi:Concanavalin A-like lectin/glucanases superfamily
MKSSFIGISACAIFTSLALGIAPDAAAQTLTHRYSFNDAPGNLTFSDSVGGASWDGTLMGSATLDGSSLQLDGFASFASLPSGMISSYSQVSIEFWATFGPDNPVWTRVFAFGDQNGGAQHTGLDYCHYAGGDWQNLNLSTTSGGVYANNPGGLNNRTNVHVTIVVDPVGNRMLYYNGTAVASNPGVNGGSVPALSGVIDTTCLIGKSLYDVDALLEGSISEFRIYQGAITPSIVALNDAAGPDNYVTTPGALQAVHLSSPANPMSVNQNSQEIFTGDFASVSGVNLNVYGGASYVSGNTSVLTVNPTNGTVHAVAPGTTMVVASYGGMSATNTLTVVSVPAVLAHRYSFTTDASDSVGSANGTLMGTATISGGKAVLDGNYGTYIDLPGDIINIQTNKAVTIEAWVDFGATPNWCRLFNFGNDGGSSEIYLAANGPGNGNQHRISENISGGRTIDWKGAWANLSAHITTVIDPPTGTMSVYRDGILEYARYDATASLSLVSTNLAVIGRSLVGADPYMPGSIDEFRIYSGALTPAEIALAHQNGPGSVNHDPGALVSIQVVPTAYPAFSGVVPPVVLANYANLANFRLQPNNSAVVNALTVTSSDPSIIQVGANNMLKTFRPGTVTLTANYMGKTSSATVTVQNVGTLTHRYSFTSDANDSVGTANGALQGAATVSGGSLVLDGSDSTYLDMPPGLLEGYDAVTVDTWVTFNAGAQWARLWYFGDDRANEFYLAPQFGSPNPTHNFNAGFTFNGGGVSGSPSWQNQTLHITCVYGNGVMALYTNGVLESGVSSSLGRLSEAGNSFSWIGKSPYADPFMNCSVDEFRIYRGQLSPEEILAADKVGPNQLLSTSATLSAATSGGNTVLAWPVAAAGFSVQARPVVGSGSWTTLTNAPTLVGNNWQVTVPASGSAQFFRLWK